MKPLAIDLFCGLGGWTEGLLAEGWHVIGFDIERHRYPKFGLPDLDNGLKSSERSSVSDPKSHKQCINRMRDATKHAEIIGWQEYPAQLVLQDVLTLHGSQFRDAALIVASPPCQAYSYRAMPWKRAKALPPPDNSLFEACFRIQREAIEAAGRFIPLVVENVRGAQKWVGRSRWNFGSFHLWGDVPALMPMTKAVKLGGGASWYPPTDPRHQPGLDFTRLAGKKVPGFRFDGSGKSFQTASVEGIKDKDADGYERDHPQAFGWKAPRTSSKSNSRKAASAAIAKIPFALSSYIARIWTPQP